MGVGRERRAGHGRASLAVSSVALLVAVAWSPAAERGAPAESRDSGYVSSRTCRTCHPDNHRSWHASFHRTMTQVADRGSVLAPWEGAEVRGRGRTLRLEVRGDELWADDVDGTALVRFLRRNPGADPPADLPRRSGPIVMTTGSHHMQIYWLRDARGFFHQLNWVWLLEDRRWVPAEDVYTQPPEGATGVAPGHWNSNCLLCHSTGPEPRVIRSGAGAEADTRVAELGIACEACHGPAAEHVRAHRNPVRRYRHHLSEGDDPTIVHPAKLDPEASTEVCGQCHGLGSATRPGELSEFAYRPGDDLDAFKRISTAARIADPRKRAMYYWPDGTTRVTGREYNALRESRCFTHGDMTCLSCHAMHRAPDDPRPLAEWADDQLAAGMDGDRACTACHAEQAQRREEHARHPEPPDGPSCYDCHMPNTTNGLLKMTRSHTVDSPTARGAAPGERPNACNLCHLDRTLAWAEEHLATWYGQPRRAEARAADSVPAALAWLARGDAVQRAAAAWHLGWPPARAASDEPRIAAWLARTLDDPYAAVRYMAARSLARLPGYEDFPYDYLATPEELRDAVRRALERAPAGTDAAEAFHALRAERDDTPITVME